MKNKFFEFYRYSEEDFRKLWDDALFIFDANVLLNLYRYSEKTTGDYLDMLEKINDRIWLPHQFALEYHEHRLEVIREMEEYYDKIINSLKKDCEAITKKLLDPYPEHPFLNSKKISSEIKKMFKKICNNIKKKKDDHPNWFKDDPISGKLTKLFENKVGDPYDNEKLKEIYKMGDDRYRKNIPPGHGDIGKDNKDKTETKKYGDLVAWFQIIDRAKKDEVPIILVTDDHRKGDWWLEVGGKIVGPRHELIKEMRSKAGVSFYLYRSKRFLKYASKHFEQTVEKETIDEVERISEFEFQPSEITVVEVSPAEISNKKGILGCIYELINELDSDEDAPLRIRDQIRDRIVRDRAEDALLRIAREKLHKKAKKDDTDNNRESEG